MKPEPQPPDDRSTTLPAPAPTPHMERKLGLLNATSINMSNIVGSGAFVTLPLLLTVMGGPHALIAWLVGAAIALADGLVWSELAAAHSGSGGSYVYLRESFGREKWGRFWSFLFVCQMISSGPLEIASGNIAVAQYLRYLWPGMTTIDEKLVAVALGLIATALLYRRIASIAKLMLAGSESWRRWVGSSSRGCCISIRQSPSRSRRMPFP